MKSTCPWWKSPKEIAALIALAALGLYLIIVHQQHMLGALPFLVILLCPLMHLFMHKGYGHKKSAIRVDYASNMSVEIAREATMVAKKLLL